MGSRRLPTSRTASGPDTRGVTLRYRKALQLPLTKVASPNADTAFIADHGTQLLRFINQVRGVQELGSLRYLNLLGTDPFDEQNCVLAQALNCEVGGSANSTWDAAARWVMRFDDLWTTRTVGIVTEQEWLPDAFEVRLPDVLVDFAVSAQHHLIETDDQGYVRGWLVPRDGHDLEQGFERLEMPGFEVALAIAA